MWLKKILVPSDNKKEITAIESWTVRWTSARSSYGIANLREEAEVFTSREDAKEFVTKLKEARSLLKDSNFEDSISIEKN